MAIATEPTVVSAPGKVLVAGGYLVLSPAYPGVVISTDARFYSAVWTEKAASTDATESFGRFVVHSCQFQGATWEFLPVRNHGGAWFLQQSEATFTSETSGRNSFLSLALLYSLRLAAEVKGDDHVVRTLAPGSLQRVAILADNDFYSQRDNGKPRSRAELGAMEPFLRQSCPIKHVHKTGLGSSAAMTTSLVGALLVHMGVVGNPPSLVDLALVHNTAQLAHCAAQGKIGSGFDVSSAVWGSQVFRRFDARALQGLLNGERISVRGSDVPDTAPPKLWPALAPSNTFWHPSPLDAAEDGRTFPTAVEGLHSDESSKNRLGIALPPPLRLPPWVHLALADVDAGSNTPSLVGKVMAWREAKPEWANQLFAVLATSVQTLADALFALRMEHESDEAAYEATMREAAGMLSGQWESLPDSSTRSVLLQARQALRSLRAGMRELGQRSGAPVEPDEMGAIVRACVEEVPGVLGGGIPGAGGYDALYVLFLAPPEAKNDHLGHLESVWASQKAFSVGPLLCGAGDPDVFQRGGGGLRVEYARNVSGLEAAIVNLA